MKVEDAMAFDDSYYDLGSFQRPVSTKTAEAQTWFDRGLIWTYGFNHEEAADCFERALQLDADCSMAYWGLAYALGPNYNKPWAIFDKEELESTVTKAHTAAKSAKEKASTATPVEQALCHAIQSRYPQDKAAKDCSIWNQQYANAMEEVYHRFPKDPDVATIYADALMNLTPWALWDLRTGEPAEGARTLEAKTILDQALTQEGGTQHPGLLHLYIHLMEMSGKPELALPVANRLRGLVPDAGHLNHMPTHLDVLCGDYAQTVMSNEDAIRADERYVARAGAANFYTIYRVHNLHFCIYGAMFAGQSRVALETVDRLEAAISEDLLRVPSPPMADWLEGFVATRVHVLVRFGRWQELLDLKLPEDKTLYCMTNAMILYGKGVALAATGKVYDAEEHRKLFTEAAKAVAPSRTLFNNTCADILAIAVAMLDGEAEYRRGNFEASFDHLSKAVHLDDSLPYDEPWGWMQPTRHAYGALLLEQGRVEEAARVYAADLGLDATLPRALQHPNNVWSLHGYHECLNKLGRDDEARIIEQQLKLAAAAADVPITSSCLCRRNA